MTTDKPLVSKACECDKVPVVLGIGRGVGLRRRRAGSVEGLFGAQADHRRTGSIGDGSVQRRHASDVADRTFD